MFTLCNTSIMVIIIIFAFLQNILSYMHACAMYNVYIRGSYKLAEK